MSRLTKKMSKNDYEFFDWNVDSEDAVSDNRTPKQILNSIKRESIYKTESGKYKFKKDICILMHDSAVKKTTVKALPSVIEYLHECGYEFDVLSKESPKFHHGVNN